MRAPVTVITASIPGREQLLARCLASVYAQTVEVEAHLVMAQSCSERLPSPVHCAVQQNWLLASVRSEWTVRLADDDQLLPHFVETLLRHLDETDVAYSWDANGDRPRLDCSQWSNDVLVSNFAIGNWIDGSGVFYRTAALRAIGGWPTDWEGPGPFEGGHFRGSNANFEDWACFHRLAVAGARFACVPQETWLYGSGAYARISTGG